MSNFGRTEGGTTATPTTAQHVNSRATRLGLKDESGDGFCGRIGSDGRQGRRTRSKRKGTVKYGELFLLGSLLVPIAAAQATSCISLKGSKACPAFETSSIDKNQAAQFPFLQFIGNLQQFDDALERYIDEGYSKQQYQDRFGCSALELSNTTNLYARFTKSVLCSSIIQASKTSCGLSDDQSRPICAEDCASWAMSEQIIVSDAKTCGDSSEQATDLIRSDFTICANPNDALTGKCVKATTNEASLCGFAENLPGFCYYCQKQQDSLESTDTCCYRSDAENICKGVELPNVTNLPPLPLNSTASEAPAKASGSKGGLSKGAIAGIVIGSVAVLVLIAILVFLLWRRKKTQQAFVPQASPRTRSSGRSRAASMTFVPQPSAGAGYEVLPGSRVARMSALEHPPTSSDTASPPPLPSGPTARRRRDNRSSSSDFGLDESPTSQDRAAFAEIQRPLHPPPPRDRNASLSSASIMMSDYPSSPIGDAEKAYSPTGQEQMPSFKDYYSRDSIYAGDKVAVLWPYDPKAPDEFGLERGDVLEVVSIWDDGWATGIKLDMTPEEVIQRKRQQRDSGLSARDRRISPGTRDPSVKAFPLVCVCLPEHWAATIESEEQQQFDMQSMAPSSPETGRINSMESDPRSARMPTKSSARFKDDLAVR